MGLEMGQLFGCRIGRQASLIDIERTVFLAQQVISLVVRRPDRATVFAFESGHLGVLAVLQHPDIAGHAGGMVLAPRILIALDILEKDAAVGVQAQLVHRPGTEKFGTGSIQSHFIDLGISPVGEQHAVHGRHQARLVNHGLPVGSESQGCFRAAVGGQANRVAALHAYIIKIQAPFAVGREDNLAAIRAPDRHIIVSRVRRKLTGFAAGYRNNENIAHIAERYLGPIRRNSRITQPERIFFRPGCLGRAFLRPEAGRHHHARQGQTKNQFLHTIALIFFVFTSILPWHKNATRLFQSPNDKAEPAFKKRVKVRKFGRFRNKSYQKYFPAPFLPAWNRGYGSPPLFRLAA